MDVVINIIVVIILQSYMYQFKRICAKLFFIVYQFIFPSAIMRNIYSTKYDCFPTISIVIKHFDFGETEIKNMVL